MISRSQAALQAACRLDNNGQSEQPHGYKMLKCGLPTILPSSKICPSTSLSGSAFQMSLMSAAAPLSAAGIPMMGPIFWPSNFLRCSSAAPTPRCADPPHGSNLVKRLVHAGWTCGQPCSRLSGKGTHWLVAAAIITGADWPRHCCEVIKAIVVSH